MIVQHNMTALNANRQLGITNTNLARSTEKLSSGYRVNRAADDAAGLSISEKMRGQIRGLEQASTNAEDGQSLIQTAEGAMDQQHAILQRARELVVQAGNTGVLDDGQTSGSGDDDFQKIQDELNELQKEFTRINEQTEFNKKKLLDGTYTDQYLQVGANDDQGISVTINKTDWTAPTVTGGAAGSGSNLLKANIDEAIKSVTTERSKLGAIQNRLEYTVKVDDNTAENMQAAESRIRDTDMADEMTRFSKESILQQAATSMLAQANQANQGVLSLLQ